MSFLSIRKLPPELDKAIRKEARRRNTTKSAVVIEALKEVFRLGSLPTKVHRNVRGFFGKMTPKEYEAFQKTTRDFSTIDDQMWK